MDPKNWTLNQIEIRLRKEVQNSKTTYNNLGAGVPAWDVLSVVKGSSVTIHTHYFPANQRYAVFLKNGVLADLNWYETQGIETGEGC